MRRLLLFIAVMTWIFHSRGQDVINIEYFFDVDPGIGSSPNTVTVTVPANTVNFTNEVLTSSGLSTGFHTLFMRAETDQHVLVSVDSTKSIANGDGLDSVYTTVNTIQVWGPYESRMVFVDESGGFVADIDSLEYFFNIDPGYGSATSINVSPDSVILVMESLQSSGLSLGFHTLFLRARAEGGEWGSAESRLVFVDESGAVTVEIDTVEYFFDVDPGYGLATGINASPDSVINLMQNIPTDSLDAGFHTLFLRARSTEGEWGQAESRLVFVQAGDVGQAVLVDRVEYFFDVDPGYGNAAFIDITPGNVVNFMDSLNADTLALGFHTLFMRARGQGGKWGQAESRLVYVDLSGALLVNITEFEWFIDTDPGYGLGNSVPIAGDVTETSLVFNVPYGVISEGSHTLGFRVKNADGTWGTTEWRPFAVFTPGRELDSASLVVMYNQLGGASWNNQSNWLSGDIDNWYGVDVVNGRVDSIELGSNNLVGELPFQAGYFNAVKKYDLSDNDLSDTIPDNFVDLVAMEELYVNANDFHELPNISGIAGLNTLALDSNLFDFGDLEPHVGISNFTYSNQKIYADSALDSIATISAALDIMLNIPVEGNNNEYQWSLNGSAIPSADLPTYQILAFAATDTGTYILEITNTAVTGLTLSSGNLRFILSDFNKDSLAMVSLYQTLGGTDWTDNTNWLTGNLSNWTGITLTGPRVTDVSLPSNNLAGEIPDNFTVADSMINIDLQDNAIVGGVPQTFVDLNAVNSIDVSGNALVSIPNFSTVPSLTTLNVANNKLDFEFLENNLGVGAGFTYAPQDSLATPIIVDITTPDLPVDTIPLPDIFVVESGSNINLAFNVGGANNQYQWIMDDTPVTGATSSNIQIDNIDFADEGNYSLRITNSIVTGLTLSTLSLEALTASLERDEAALLELYNANDGENWSPPVNWTSAATINDWDAIVIPEGVQRVEELDLSGRGVKGDLTRDIRVITGLKSVMLQNNELSGLPNMSQMPNLDTLNVTNNFLSYPSLEPNIFLDGFAFNPQSPLPVNPVVQVAHGNSIILDAPVSGNNNSYEWYFDGTAISGETGATLTLDSAVFEDMGDYHKQAVSSIISQVDPSFFVRTTDQDLQVTADIDVTALYANNSGTNVNLEEGFGFLFKSNDPGEVGPLDSITFNGETAVPITGAGLTFEDVVLDEYLIFIRTEAPVGADQVELIPTYYENTIDWAEADTLELRQDAAITVNMEEVPEPSVGEGIVGMIVESDFADDPGGRLEARRRVKKAGCSLRRRRTTGGGRPAQDEEFVLIAYKETDDNGEVNFGNLPNGFYRLNIQYPGIPVDPNSFVEFEIDTDGGVGGYELAATVTEDAITVDRILALTTAYFKDLSVYPVPANNEVSISYRRLREHDVFVQVVDLKGATIVQQQLPKGINQKLVLDVSKIKDGIYLMHFFNRDHEQVASYKVIVRH